jgi:hypothetical protein
LCFYLLTISLVQTPRKEFYGKIFQLKSVMIKLLVNLKVFGTFHLNPIRELVGYNEKLQPQKVVVEVITKIVGHSSCA